MAQNMAPLHELLEVHEMINFQTVTAFKAKMMQGLAKDADLKKLLDKQVEQSVIAIQGLQMILQNARIQ